MPEPTEPGDYEQATGHDITSTAGYNDHRGYQADGGGETGANWLPDIHPTSERYAYQRPAPFTWAQSVASTGTGDTAQIDIDIHAPGHEQPVPVEIPLPEAQTLHAMLSGVIAEHARTTPDNPPASSNGPDNLRDRIADAVQPLLMDTLPKPIAAARAQEVADTALAAIQGAYVPPPPGSDRDALPEDLRALIAPHMPEYVSTACQTALALDRASTIHLPSMTTLMHNACRLTRKQDMARCACDCHGLSAH